MSDLIVVVNSLQGGGAEKVTVLLSNYLQKEGHKITLVLFRKRGVFIQDLNSALSLVALPRFFDRLHLAGRVLALWWVLMRHPAKVLLSVGEWPNVVSPLANNLLFRRKRIVIAEHSSRTFINQPEAYNQPRFIKPIAQLAYGLASEVVGVSEEITLSLRKEKCLSNKVTTINNPISVDEIEQLSCEEVAHPFITYRTLSLFISVGRLIALKDHSTMIRALAVNPNMRLIIVGDGPERPRLESLIKELGVGDRVDLVGFQSNPYRFLVKADYFIHSSTYEGFPVVFIEAMACGLPIVTTDCNIPNDLFEKTNSNSVTPIGDHKKMAEAIIAIAERSHNRDLIRKSVSHLDINYVGKQYEKVIFKVSG